MLLEKQTQEKYGYSLDSVSAGSNKLVVSSCDYCKNEYSVIMKIRNKSNLVVNKDCCNSCKYVKRDEACIIKYGVKNPASTTTVKDKIRQSNIDKYGCESYIQTNEFKDKSNATKMKRYGTTNVMEVESIKGKQQSSILNKYGVTNISMLDKTKDKVKKTCLEKYGSENFLSSDIAKEKITNTNIAKYGVANQFERECIKEKIKLTNIANLGVEYPTQNKSIMDKIHTTNYSRYGYKNVAMNSIIRAKMIRTNISRYGYDNVSKNKDILYKSRQTSIKNGFTKIYNGKTMRELSDELGKAYSTFVVQVRDCGFDTAIQMKSKENGLEAIIKTLLDKHNINYIQHARVNGRYTDFLIEDSKLVLELDGIYWHCDEIIKDKNYHAVKQKAYTDAGYRSMFFREDEVHTKVDIVESMILNAVHKNVKIFARKCDLKKIDRETAKKFFLENHLMGSGKGDTYALTHNNIICSAIQIKRTKDKCYEVSRFCNAKKTSITGGFSKLLKYVESNINMTSLTTFIDLRYGTGDYLPLFGFNKASRHISFKWAGNGVTFGRMVYPNNTGYEAGLAKIWDCGQLKFIKVY